MIVVLTLVIVSCTSEPTAEARCLGAVGELHAVATSSDELLQQGVSQMRDDDAIQKLQSLSERYATLLEGLDEISPTIPPEALEAHELLTGGVRLQQEAWIAIEEGLRTGDPRDIFEGADLIGEAREQLENFNVAIPDCSDEA